MGAELYMGARPGRRTLMLTLSAALLAAALGLAWFQVRSARALGPEQAVPNTPLRIRLPAGWHPARENPQIFLSPTKEGERRKLFEFERRIEIKYLRLPTFQPLDRLLRMQGWENVRGVSPARIGPYDAVQVQRIEPRAIGRNRVVRLERLVRITCLPRGQVIQVIYETLVELRPADEEILDDVCRTLRVDDATLDRQPAAYLSDAGLQFALDEAWTVVGAPFAEVPGVYIGGSVDGVPAWSLGIFRTWLATGRTPADLLADVAAEEWLLWDADVQVQESRRPDGATVASLRHPRFGVADETPVSARVVTQSAAAVVIMFVYAGPRNAALANEIAERIAGAVQILPLEMLPDLSTAEQAGQRLSEALAQRGALPRWGRKTAETDYHEVLSGRETVAVMREARGGNPENGYEGLEVHRRAQHEDAIRWRIDGHAQTYDWQWEFEYETLPVRITEQRRTAEGDVVRTVAIRGRQPATWTYRSGSNFVPPPTESILAGWVARGEADAALIAVSSLFGPGVHTELLRRLPPDGSYPRVLVQQDYRPLGSIQAYDDDRGEEEYELGPAAEYRRATK